MEAPNPMITPSNGVINFKEFYNFEDYYIKISYNDIEDLFIVCYNIEKLDGIRYEFKMNIKEIYNLNNIFRQYTNIKDIYELILDLIIQKNYSIKTNSKNDLIFSFNITDINRNNKTVEFILNKSSNNNSEEYINILSNEIKNLRKLREEISEIKDMIAKNNMKINLNRNNEKFGKICNFCGNANNLKKCTCGKYYCDKCILNNKNIECQKKCFLFNNNLNTLSSYYQISKIPLPKNFEVKIYFEKVHMIRMGITFDSNIVKEKNIDNNSPLYDIYYIYEGLKNFYTYKRGWIHNVFKPGNELKSGDDLIMRLKNGKLSYLHNGVSIGDSYSLDINKINNKDFYLLVHRRNDYSQCQLKYIYELID